MNLFNKIIEFLNQSAVSYQLLTHAPVYTSEQAAAARADVSLHQGAKAMVIKVQRSKIKDQSGKGIFPTNYPAASGTPPNGGGKLPATDYVMCVLPGDRKIDFKKLKSVLGTRDATLASPVEVEKTVGVKIGAVSPFGNLSGLPVLLDDSITDSKEIVFNAGDHSKSVKMKLSDYLLIVGPEVLSFSQ